MHFSTRTAYYAASIFLCAVLTHLKLQSNRNLKNSKPRVDHLEPISKDFLFGGLAKPGRVTHGVLTWPDTVLSCPIEKRGHTILQGGDCSGDSLGNYLAAIYISALRAFQRRNTFSLYCNGKNEKSVLQRFISGKIWKMNLPEDVPDLCESCQTWSHTCGEGLNYAVPMIRDTLRQIPPPADLDEVTIHLRCGDLLGSSFHYYGYPPYIVYKEHLAPFKSIGILTSTLHPEKGRLFDAKNSEPCLHLVQDMVNFFESAFPDANVTIRSEDTLEEAYGRIIHSNQVWCNPSTFCVFPSIASMGTAYILKTDLYPFVDKIDGENNIHVVDQPFLSMLEMTQKGMTTADIANWLRS